MPVRRQTLDRDSTSASMRKSASTKSERSPGVQQSRPLKHPALVALKDARDELSTIVRKSKRGSTTLIGSSESGAKSMFVPAGSLGPQQPTAVHEIPIEKLRRRLRTIREEVENSGAAYRVLVNGSEAATFCATQAAWDTKISRSRGNMIGLELEALRGEIRLLREVLDDQAKDRVEVDRKLSRILAFAQEWLKDWRREHGHPEVPLS
jgi:hypothetical protein